MSPTFRLLPAALALAAPLFLTGCVGQDDDPISDGNSPEDVMELAKESLDETTGVDLSVTSSSIPDDVSGAVLVSADGTAMHPASFEGSITGSLSGFTAEGDVVAIDGEVWINLPLVFGPGWEEIDPDEVGAPDPGQLIATEGGLSDLLVNTDDLEKGDEVRGGEDNKEVLTEYTGTLDGDRVQVLIPSAHGDTFDVSYQVDSEGRLVRMEITGEFYEGSDDTAYQVEFDAYDVDKDISEP